MLAGGGRFGKLALQRIPERIAIVADLQPDQEVAGLAKAAGAELWQRDAVEAVVEALAGRNRPVEWIIPMAPIHLLAKWIAADLARKNPVFGQVPDQLIPEVKMRHRGENGEVYVSLADFMCPDDCPEPVEICTHTGKPRGAPMFKRISDIKAVGMRVGVLRSIQLAPGVGGLPVHEMLQLKQEVGRLGGEWLLATACRCHGLISYVEFKGGGAK